MISNWLGICNYLISNAMLVYMCHVHSQFRVPCPVLLGFHLLGGAHNQTTMTTKSKTSPRKLYTTHPLVKRQQLDLFEARCAAAFAKHQLQATGPGDEIPVFGTRSLDPKSV